MLILDPALTAIYQTPSLPLIGLEEPDLMVHPAVIGVLSDILLEAANRSQLILTTHSPDLISRFPAEFLRIVNYTDGATQIGSLREDQREVINASLFSGGDLLRLEGLKRGQ
jgi:predicted ATPase